MSSEERLHTYLFAPGSSAKLVLRVFDTDTDAVVLDLEDGVAEAQKAAARSLVARTVRERKAAVPVFVRINAIGGPHWLEDLDAVVTDGVAGLRIPKVEAVEEIAEVAQALAAAEARKGLAPRTITVDCTIESAQGVSVCEALAACDPRVRALVFGSADFANDINAVASPAGIEALYARSRMVIASRLAGLIGPIDGAFTNVEDVAGLRASAQHARVLGFSGKSAIHPEQLPVIKEAFTPSEDAVRAALRALKAYEVALSNGAGATLAPDGTMIDAATAAAAALIAAQGRG